QATFTASSLTLGFHSISASYGGNSSFLGATSSGGAVTLGQDTTTTAPTSSGNPSPLGGDVTVTATVHAAAPGAGAPPGQVTFYDGATALGTSTLNASRQASLALTSLAGGSHTITAVYNGDANFTTSTSTALTQTVNLDSVALTASLTTPVYGQGVTLTA